MAGPLVSGARLPSILLFASCLSSRVTFSEFLRMSGAYWAVSVWWPMDMPTRSYRMVSSFESHVKVRLTKVSTAALELSTMSSSNFITPGSNNNNRVLPPNLK